jgi:hypothetical protein
VSHGWLGKVMYTEDLEHGGTAIPIRYNDFSVFMSGHEDFKDAA